MKIGFDARMIDHPGIGRYIRNLLSVMLAEKNDYQFILYGDPAKLKGFQNCRVEKYTDHIYSWREFFSSPFEDRKLDIVHVPHFNVAAKKIKRLVITIHDLIYLNFPESRTSFLKGIAADYAIPKAIDKADKVIAVSKNTRKDIIKKRPDARRKIEVIYEGVDPVFCQINDEDKKTKVRDKYKLPKDMILFVGSLKRHKNIGRLIDAYVGLRSKGMKHKLVIIGRYSPREPEVLTKIKSTDVIYFEKIPDKDLVGIYNLADMLVMPSLYEGFGLPALEAMACGVPVAASMATSLPEVVGNAGVMFDPYDVADISRKIDIVLNEPGFRGDLAEKGLKRIQDFSWQEAGRRTLNFYHEALK